uniref:Leucine-rich repeat-containing protein 31 isoform X2 n=1 Tax=Geotrypetes seraphini TaxID=260995 RepID=A0A6P8SBD6_GEOSA|nr:leucine-rich repeat-containing protein 31 isoform X2 [Geotrypetes seraphini]
MMDKRGSQGSQKRNKDGFLKRSPFALILNQIQKKTSLRQQDHSSVAQLYKGPGEDESKTEETTDSKISDDKNSIANCYHQDVSEAVRLLPFLPDVEEFDVSWNDFIGGALSLLTVELHHLSKLKILRLNNCRLTADDTNALGKALCLIPQLEEMDLSWNGKAGGNLHLLMERFQKGCSLKVLMLIDCNLTSEDGTLLAQALGGMQNLEVLDLSMNKNIGSSLRVIAQELQNAPHLSVLKLHKCGLNQDSVQYVGTALRYLPYLRKLDLSCNKEAGGGFKDSAPVASLKHLQVLDLHQCCITEADMEALTQVIPLLASLEVLNISSNKNIGSACEHLLSRLRFLPKLKSVFLNNCALQEGSFTALADATLQLSGMKELDLSWNKCVGGRLKQLLDALSLAADFQVLSLSSCALLADDLATLASVLQKGHLQRLRKLDLSYNDTVSDEGWTLFFQHLHMLKELSELDVSLRPSSSRYCGTWFSDLLASLIKLPAFTEVGVQRWVLTAPQQQQLKDFKKEDKKDIQFDCCSYVQDITK